MIKLIKWVTYQLTLVTIYQNKLMRAVALTMREQEVTDDSPVRISGSKVIFKVTSKVVTGTPERSDVKILVTKLSRVLFAARGKKGLIETGYVLRERQKCQAFLTYIF